MKKIDCDLLVFGGGASGMVAAVRAAQLTGKKVIVLEKTKTTGGGALFAGATRTFGSKWQKDRNLPDTTAEYARQMMDSVYWRLDTKLVANCLRGTGQFFDWLCEQVGGIEDMFVVGQYVFPTENDPLGPVLDFKKHGKGFGRLVVDTLKQKCEIFGVEIFTNHPVVDIEMENNKIVAGIAKSEAGLVRIACKACILATGSWISNEDALEKYYPEFAGMRKWMDPNPHINPAYTGDGIPLAEKAGAFVDYENFCLRLMGPMHVSKSKVFLSMAQSPFIITVNLNGKRYASEPVGHMPHFEDGHVQIAQPHGQSFDIFDENTLLATFKLPKRTQTAADLHTLGDINLPDTMEEVYSSIEDGFAKGDPNIFRADSLEELADQIGVDKGNFIETVRKYNECCESGFDWEYFKNKDTLVPINKPPYYGFIGKLMTDGAFGGVKVNPEMQAYKPDGGLIEGLYVAGDFSSGRFISLGGVKRQVINDLAWAFSSGFLAGTNAGKYLETLD